MGRVLVAAAEQCRAHAGKKLRARLSSMHERIGRTAVIEHLEASGWLGREEDGPLSATRHPVRRPVEHAELLARAHRDAVGDHPLEPASSVLLSLVGPTHQLEVVAPTREDQRRAEPRIAAAAETTEASGAVKAALEAIDAAVVAAVTAATAAGVATGSN